MVLLLWTGIVKASSVNNENNRSCHFSSYELQEVHEVFHLFIVKSEIKRVKVETGKF
jgi:hypothetical protein